MVPVTAYIAKTLHFFTVLTSPAEHSSLTQQLPRTRFPSRTRKAGSVLTATALIALCTSGCSAVQGPQPDRTIVSLEASALSVARSQETGSDVANAWSELASALHAEVSRLCGKTDDGATPTSCLYTIDPTTGEFQAESQRTQKNLTKAAENNTLSNGEYTINDEVCAASTSQNTVADTVATTPVTALDALIASLSEVDASSRPLITEQFVQASIHNSDIPSLHLDTTSDAELVSTIYSQLPSLRGCDTDFAADLSQTDKQAVEKALNWQEASQYGLTTAAAYTDPATGNLMVAAAREHGDVEHALQTLVPAASTASAAGYATPTVTPADEETALQYAILDGVETTRMWSELASSADNAAWRELCVRAAGQAAQSTLPLLAAAGLSPEDAGLIPSHDIG